MSGKGPDTPGPPEFSIDSTNQYSFMSIELETNESENKTKMAFAKMQTPKEFRDKFILKDEDFRIRSSDDDDFDDENNNNNNSNNLNDKKDENYDASIDNINGLLAGGKLEYNDSVLAEPSIVKFVNTADISQSSVGSLNPKVKAKSFYKSMNNTNNNSINNSNNNSNNNTLENNNSKYSPEQGERKLQLSQTRAKSFKEYKESRDKSIKNDTTNQINSNQINNESVIPNRIDSPKKNNNRTSFAVDKLGLYS